jgi:hypothetical protein
MIEARERIAFPGGEWIETARILPPLYPHEDGQPRDAQAVRICEELAQTRFRVFLGPVFSSPRL